MTTKYPRDIDAPECPWCDGSGEAEVELPDGTTARRTCQKCNGTGWARLDLTDVLARTREEGS